MNRIPFDKAPWRNDGLVIRDADGGHVIHLGGMTNLAGQGEPDHCESKWDQVTDCPNPPEFLIVVTSRVGFAVMCGPHKDSFDALARGRDYTIEPYSVERARELQALVDRR